MNAVTTDTALTYNARRWDRVRWERRADEHEGIRQSELTFADRLIDVPSAERKSARQDARTFAGEVFSRLVGNPERLETPAAPWAGKAQDAIDEIPEFAGLAEQVRGDSDMAALATRHLLDSVGERLASLDADETPEGEPSRAAAGMRAALRRGLAKATEEVVEAREALEGLAPGMGSAPTPSEQEDTTRLMLAKMLTENPAFREVLRRAGMLRRMAASTAKRRAKGVGTVVGLERGADLGRVLPAGLARLRHRRMRTLVHKDIAERALLQYRIEGHEPQGRGPIVLLVDESYSMTGRGMRWAKAAVIAAIRQGVAEKRPVWLAYFDTQVLNAYHLEADGTAHAISTTDPAEVIGSRWGNVSDLTREALTRGASGGTDFGPALAWGLDVLERAEERADMILVTDGLAHADAATVERLTAQKERGTRLFGLTVNGGRLSPTIEALCTEAVDLDETPEEGLPGRLAGTVPTAP